MTFAQSQFNKYSLLFNIIKFLYFVVFKYHELMIYETKPNLIFLDVVRDDDHCAAKRPHFGVLGVHLE
jgi:hypothetical protein